MFVQEVRFEPDLLRAPPFSHYPTPAVDVMATAALILLIDGVFFIMLGSCDGRAVQQHKRSVFNR